MNSPEISVLMPAYNAGSFVADAIYSVLRQSHSDFELVVLNDGSVDNTAEVVRRIGDSRIRFVDNDRNQGLVGVRNELLSLARGEYIAWLDADDLATADRLQKQVTLLKKHRDMVLVGGYVQPFSDDSSRKYKLWKYPVHSDELKSRMIFDDPIATSATMIRRDVVLRERLEFRPGYRTGEDYDFWERLSHFGAMASVPEVLAYYRIHQYQTSFSASEAERNAVLKIQGRQLDRLGVEPTPDERQLHLRLGLSDNLEPDELAFVESWLRRLIAA
ncbi:MAG: glycosyltransferase family 2 protein, partial [Leptospiraceae bacterium]|nr:glycosyltransferase family 2 protein [Leptospiraceae bacterium]